MDATTLAERLSRVPLSAPREDLGGLRAVGRSALAEALVGGATTGPTLWANAQRRDGCTLPMPSDEHVVNGKLEGGRRAVALLAPEAVLTAARKILGRRESARFLVSDAGYAAIGALLERCGAHAPAEAFPPFAEAVEACRRELDEEQAQLAVLEPLLSNGDGAGRIRMIMDQDSGELLVSALDLLRCAGVDKDGEASDWRNWLEGHVASWMEAEAPHSPGASPGCEMPDEVPRLRLLKHLRLPGERNPTPMVSYAVAEKMLVECAQRGKMPPEYTEQATRLMNRFRVGDQRLHADVDAAARTAPPEARAFVLGVEEAARQQNAAIELSAQELVGRAVAEHLPGVLAEALAPLVRDIEARAQVRAQEAQAAMMQAQTEMMQVMMQAVMQAQERAQAAMEAQAQAMMQAVMQHLATTTVGHVVHETTRNYNSNSAEQNFLKEHGREPALEPLQYADDGPLEITRFVENKLPLEQHYVVVHFKGAFSAEVKRRRLLQYNFGTGENRFWVTYKLGEYRLAYTEADRDLMDEVWGLDETQQYLRRQLESHRPRRPPAHSSRAVDRPARLRRGPYARPVAAEGALAAFFAPRAEDGAPQ
jgi:hypothetical protein